MHPAERVHAVRFDAEDPPTSAAWIDEAAACFGRIDALVNNAGILRMVTLEAGTEDDLDAMWATNVKAPFRLIRAALPHLRAAGRGRVVNIASTDAKRYRDGTASLGYVMTKHALLAMTHAARFAGWEDGVRATAICPGAIDTEMISRSPRRDTQGQPSSTRDGGRHGRVRAVAAQSGERPGADRQHAAGVDAVSETPKVVLGGGLTVGLDRHRPLANGGSGAGRGGA